MGIFDSFKNKAGDLMEKAKDQAGDLAGKAKDHAGDVPGQAGDMANDQTGGRFGSQIDQGADIAKQRMGDGDQAEPDQQG